MARLMREAMTPVRRPTRKANVHFKKMYCSTSPLDLLLQSCLNRSFSLILHFSNTSKIRSSHALENELKN